MNFNDDEMTDFVRNDYAYGVWICMCDEESCEICKEMNDFYFVVTPEYDLPFHRCISKRGCKCNAIYTPVFEEGASYIVEFLLKHNGRAPVKLVEEYIDSLSEIINKPSRDFHDRVNELIGIVQSVAEREQSNPFEAIALYRKTIGQLVALSSNALFDSFTWKHLCYAYNRLTLVLEKNNRKEEALREILSFEKMDISKHCTKAELQSILKRKNRLLDQK